ncbi:MAG TPA: hypothetical protein VJ521_06265, partial [Acidobacteriota bacterium]|nr:hypothetical protein [Acidobacteriota bacterium]
AGETFQVVAPDEDLLAPNFSPDGWIISAHLSRWFKRQAKKFVDKRKIYPFFKLSQMIFQDHATVRLAKRYHASILFSDGNTLLSATGRAANYLRAASEQTVRQTTSPIAEDLVAVYRYIVDGVEVPAENQRRLPSLRRGRLIYRVLSRLGIRGVWLPDVVILIDVSPQIALTRIARRPKVDLHENLADLHQAREMYLKTVDAFQEYRSPNVAHVIPIDQLSPGETARKILEIIRASVVAENLQQQSSHPLGTSTDELSGGAAWKKILSYRYIVRYLLAKFFQNAWREPIFVFSRTGKLFLKEGYSAAVMRAIYDHDQTNPGLLDKIFLQYPLHRAVYDRLQILTRKIEPILEKQLAE